VRITTPAALALSAFVALPCFLALGAASTSADDPRWPALARRIANADPWRTVALVAGAEPPGVPFPLPSRPSLPLVGSTWSAPGSAAFPQVVHYYYAPSPQADAVAKTLAAKLAAAGYARMSPNGYLNGFVGDDRGFERWCSRALRGRSADIHRTTVESVPALDIRVAMTSGSWRCIAGPEEDTPIPALGNISGLRIAAGMRASGGEGNTLESAATVRTALPAADAFAALAARFTARGWQARPAVVDASTTVEHFSRVGNGRRWDALLELEHRGNGVYDASLLVTNGAVGPAGR
jgi:hypothetical protein